MRNFILLVGGPGLFKGCDKMHDQVWSNYIIPLQLAVQRNLYKLENDEKVHWFVYEPPYRMRWFDDLIIDDTEAKQIDEYWLHRTRQKAAEKVAQSGASSYINKIQRIATLNGATYTGLQKPIDFWMNLAKFPDHSVSRIWYTGHASEDGLMLALMHSNDCKPQCKKSDMISIKDIGSYSYLSSRFDTKTKDSSKFYGCYTDKFALEWNKIFSVPTEGAENKIDFSVINKPSKIPNVMERLQKTPTSKGIPNWKNH